MLLLVLVAVPLVIGVAGFFLGKTRITPLELGIQVGLVGALIVGGYYLTRWGGLQDYELWNGRIASKPWGNQGCCHSYPCNCRQECSGTGDEYSCGEVCDTCYKHAGDYYHEAYTTNGEQAYRSSCDTGTPDRWTKIRIGEPSVVEHRFTNYIKADPRALIRPATRPVTTPIPAYPPIVSDFKARRFLFIGIMAPAAAALDEALDELNADLGPRKQVNVIVVVVAEAEPAYFDALAAAWLGGKKNDVILVIGAPAFPAIAWTRVMAWNVAAGGEDEFKGGLAMRVQGLGSFDGPAILAILREEIDQRYQRRSFSEFEYLMARARPPRWAVGVLFGVGLGLSGLLQWLFWRNARRMTGAAPHVRARQAATRLAGWWRARRDGSSGHVSAAAAGRVSIQHIEALAPIAGADRVVTARVGGRTVVVERGQFEVGDRCIYVEPGSVLPAGRPWSEFLRKHEFRVTTRTVRGVRSEGLALPLSIVDGLAGQGAELAALLGIRADVSAPDEADA